jgi:PAS domain-containing protein
VSRLFLPSRRDPEGQTGGTAQGDGFKWPARRTGDACSKGWIAIPGDITLTALRDRDGNLQGFSEFSHDLSESKVAGAKYRGLLEAAPDAMVVVNQVGEIVLLNVQAEKQFGYRRDELVGQKVKNIIPEGLAERLIADGTGPRLGLVITSP